MTKLKDIFSIMFFIIFSIICSTKYTLAIPTNITSLHDAMPLESSPNNNYGQNSQLRVVEEAGAERNIYYGFDFAGIGTVSSANFSVWCFSNTNPSASKYMSMYFCNDSFDEDALTWNNKDTLITDCYATAFVEPATDTFSATTRYDFNITKELNAFVGGNFSIKLKITPDGGTYRTDFWTGDDPAATTKHPVVKYTLAINDTTPPNVTLLYPTNGTHYNNFNNSIYANCSDTNGCDTCGINNTNWTAQGFDGSNWLFNRSSTPNANHSLSIWCTDTLNNNGSIDFWFVTDLIVPVISGVTPANNSYHNSDFSLTVDYTDTWLWRTNTTIHGNGTQDRYVSSVDIALGTYTSGNLASMKHNDVDYYRVTELAANPALTVYFNLTNTPTMEKLDFVGLYTGNPAHNVMVYIWNTTGWEELGGLPSGVWTTINTTWVNSENYTTNNVVQLLVNHTGNGVNTHTLDVDLVHAYSSDVYFNNYSGNLSGTTTVYNVSETISVDNWADGMYTYFMEATDTHTTSYFDEELITATVYTGINNNNYKTTYSLSQGIIEFTYPVGLDLQTEKLTDRFTQKFINVGSLDEIEIEIDANSVVYLPQSYYPCHLIINNAYWFDCVGLPDPQIVTADSTHFVVKSFTGGNDFTFESLGGLNYINLTYNLFLDFTAPSFLTNSSSSTSTTTTLNFDTSENVTVQWLFGLNCTDNLDTGSETLNDTFSLVEAALTASTVYWYNVTIIDVAGNNVTECFNVSTAAAAPTGAGCNCTQVRSIVREEIGRETMYLSMGVIILGVIGMLLYFSKHLDFLYFKDREGNQIPIMKHLVTLTGGWMLLVVANLGVRAAEVLDSTILPSMNGFYAAVLWIMIASTSFWLLGLMFYIFKGLGKAGRNQSG